MSTTTLPQIRCCPAPDPGQSPMRRTGVPTMDRRPELMARREPSRPVRPLVSAGTALGRGTAGQRRTGRPRRRPHDLAAPCASRMPQSWEMAPSTRSRGWSRSRFQRLPGPTPRPCRRHRPRYGKRAPYETRYFRRPGQRDKSRPVSRGRGSRRAGWRTSRRRQLPIHASPPTAAPGPAWWPCHG